MLWVVHSAFPSPGATIAYCKRFTFTSQQWLTQTECNTGDVGYFGDINQKVHMEMLETSDRTKVPTSRKPRSLIQPLLEAIDQRLKGRQKQAGSRKNSKKSKIPTRVIKSQQGTKQTTRYSGTEGKNDATQIGTRPGRKRDTGEHQNGETNDLHHRKVNCQNKTGNTITT